MEITVVNTDHVFRPSRGGLPLSYTIGTVQIVCENNDQLYQMVEIMQRYANGTFDPVIMEREEPEAPLVISEDTSKTEEPEVFIDPITGATL